ncbi:cellulose biosynthesis cyclic di-GMP-binding regulatory protein BcsB [Acidovorax sp. NB1]|uniref:cellulose biosynthesis cyclic di-GMP-binding regulatory protein BcsB n=1 Tax=Acidovorax sp. NB1 TaxID=1943571 RepID=UPI0010D3443D|nr:cellulose biosynthesis cyclic di-GMP-binding regulatory protein BcsB [Acidovorax sp. NB1]GDY35145.1 cellulose synthase regulator [Acidovorax sp. NB1]
MTSSPKTTGAPSILLALIAVGLISLPAPVANAQPSKSRDAATKERAQARPERDGTRNKAASAEPGAIAAAVATLPPLPSRQWKVSLKDLGMARPIALRGVDSEASVGVGVRRDEAVETARLRLTFTLSPALIPALSHLKVMLNDETLQTLVLDKERLGTPQTVELNIDPRYFTDYNRFRFQFIGHYTMECETPNHSSLWATISNESQIELSLRQIPLRDDLALLPAPFFDPRDNRPVNLPFVYGNKPSKGTLKASGSIASWIGMLAGYRGNQFPVFENQLPRQHAVVLATNDNRPAFLQNQPPVEDPTLSVVPHPDVPGAKLLLVLGKDDAQLQMAADALALGKAVLSGQSIAVKSLEYPALAKPYDAPRWITTERPVKLAELVSGAGDLQLRGSVLNDTVNVYTRMAPDLFTWNAKGVPLDLTYRYTPNSVSDHGALNISINNQFIQSYPLQSREDRTSGKSTIMLPLFDDGSAQTRSDLKIPAFMIGGDNQLQFAFQIPPNDLGRCRSAPPTELFAAIDPQSTIDLTAFRHYLAMPNLAAYANSGFPFTRVADLAQTSVILPNQPTPADVEVFLTAMGRMSASTGYPGTRFTLLHAAEADKAADTDILVISQGDSDGLLEKWKSHLPALLAAGARSVQPLERAMGSFIDLFNLEPHQRLSASGGQAILQGKGPLAAVTGFESPLSSGRTVVALTATDKDAMSLLSLGLNDAGKIKSLRGDLGLMRGDAIESFRIKPVYYVGDLPWWQRLWFHMHSHPLLLALVGIGTGLLLTFIVYAALRSMARRRLAAHHD